MVCIWPKKKVKERDLLHITVAGLLPFEYTNIYDFVNQISTTKISFNDYYHHVDNNNPEQQQQQQQQQRQQRSFSSFDGRLILVKDFQILLLYVRTFDI
ncbi:hypothetical protein DERF_008644 [Dermatophagoides farinae]|uniref:Uncharacterized protein n=1 Tax=Dermatophagoides farinae TaxID=6954 RepID=A0A922I4X0_DERFA|nr:hypothetical protein DERF_008644 [Dermatophagoides farinae]